MPFACKQQLDSAWWHHYICWRHLRLSDEEVPRIWLLCHVWCMQDGSRHARWGRDDLREH